MVIISAKDFLKYRINTQSLLKLNEPKTEYTLETKKKKVHHYYDKLYKQILNHKEEFINLINNYTDYTKYTKKLKVEDIEKYDKEFITRNFQKRESDIIYKLKKKEFYFILEQQTKIDKDMAIRMPEYSLDLIKKVKSEKKLKGKYPLVYPIVLYTGKKKWNAPKSISEVQEEYDRIPLQNFPSYNLIDINEWKIEDIIKDKSLIAKAILFAKINTKEELERVLKLLKQREMTEKEIEIIAEMLVNSDYIDTEIKQEEIEKYKRFLKGGDSMVMGYEKAFVELVRDKIKKGEEQGMKQGMKQGMQKGILQVAKNMLSRNMSIKDIEEITGLTEKEIMKLKAV